MLSRNDGIILAELLLSLGVLLMLGLFFIPLLIDLTGQTRTIRIERQSLQLLYDELQANIVDPQSLQNHTTVINGIHYQIIVRDSTPNGQKEVCVKVEKSGFIQETNICRVSE